MEKKINDHGHSVGRMVLLQNLILKHKITPKLYDYGKLVMFCLFKL